MKACVMVGVDFVVVAAVSVDVAAGAVVVDAMKCRKNLVTVISAVFGIALRE